MEIRVNEKCRIVEFWLTNAEKNDIALRESLKPQYQKWKAENYLPVVYESGKRDLCAATSALLCYNRKRRAQLDVQREKRQRTAHDR